LLYSNHSNPSFHWLISSCFHHTPRQRWVPFHSIPMFHELKQFARTLTFTPPNWLAGRGVASLGPRRCRSQRSLLCRCYGALAAASTAGLGVGVGAFSHTTGADC
jgi:hypothetical protein